MSTRTDIRAFPSMGGGAPLAHQGVHRAKRKIPNAFWFLLATSPLFLTALFTSGKPLAFAFMLGIICIGGIAFSFASAHEALYILAFAIPMDQAFYWYAGARYNALSYLTFVMVGVWMVIHGRFRSGTTLTRTEYLVIGWLVWSGLSLVWTRDFITGSGLLLANTSGLVTLYLFNRGFKNTDHLRRCAWFYLAGALIVAALMLPYYHPDTLYIHASGRHGSRVIVSALGGGFGFAPAEVSRTLAYCMIFALLLWQYETSRFKRRLSLVLAMAFGVMVPLCLCRTTVVALAVALLAWGTFIGGKVKLGTQLKRLAAMLALAAAIVVLAGVINKPATMNRVDASSDEYERGDLRRLTTGRSYLWANSWQFFLEHPVLGLGLGSFGLSYSERNGVAPRAVHNEYLKALSELGIFGTLFFLGWMGSLGLQSLRMKTPRHVALAWWIIFFIVIGGGDLYRAKDIWMAMGFIAAFARFEKESKWHRTLSIPPPRKQLSGKAPLRPA